MWRMRATQTQRDQIITVEKTCDGWRDEQMRKEDEAETDESETREEHELALSASDG